MQVRQGAKQQDGKRYTAVLGNSGQSKHYMAANVEIVHVLVLPGICLLLQHVLVFLSDVNDLVHAGHILA